MPRAMGLTPQCAWAQADVVALDDQWTVVTADGRRGLPSACLLYHYSFLHAFLMATKIALQ